MEVLVLPKQLEEPFCDNVITGTKMTWQKDCGSRIKAEEKLARHVTDGMDMEALYQFVMETLEREYDKMSDPEFNEAWTGVFGDD